MIHKDYRTRAIPFYVNTQIVLHVSNFSFGSRLGFSRLRSLCESHTRVMIFSLKMTLLWNSSSVLQRVAMCCTRVCVTLACALQRVPTQESWYSVSKTHRLACVRITLTHCNTLQHIQYRRLLSWNPVCERLTNESWSSVCKWFLGDSSTCVEACCSVLQCVAVCCSRLCEFCRLTCVSQ